jgi:hypothetical protein
VLTKYNSVHKIKKSKMGCACNMHGEKDGCKEGTGGEISEKKPLRRPRRRCEDNKMDLQEVEWGHGLD